ncbi:MAG TPA: efflux RND transporter periplasmic adaptor subunit [Thermoanaerobaculia bacterium]|nr:efflux RND transporter periplasmic adaptor subunit [Thermoanaerobaculia bacterium]
MKKLLFIPLVAALAACGSDPKPGHAARAVPAEVETVAATTIESVREAPGSIRAALSSDLSSKALGNIKAIHVQEGDRVSAGQLLLEIDAAELDAQVARARGATNEVDSAIAGALAAQAAAQSQFALAKSTYDRFRVLRDRNSVSAQEFDEVEARYRGAEAELTRAARGVDQARGMKQQVTAETSAANAMSAFGRIRAPFAGVVARKYVDPGAQAAPGMPLLRIDADRDFRFEAAVDDALAASIQPGTLVRVRIGASDRIVTGRVAEVVPAIDPGTRTSIVKIALDGSSPAIRSGMYGSALIPTGARPAITVPVAAVARRGQLENIWVVGADGKARLRLVRSGAAIDDRIEILSGLAAGERVIVSRPAGLAEGVTVAVSGEGR